MAVRSALRGGRIGLSPGSAALQPGLFSKMIPCKPDEAGSWGFRSAPPGRKASLASLPSIPLRFMLGYDRPLPTGARSQASTPYGSKKPGVHTLREQEGRRPRLTGARSQASTPYGSKKVGVHALREQGARGVSGSTSQVSWDEAQKPPGRAAANALDGCAVAGGPYTFECRRRSY
jgi:hypothetical protein